MLKKFGNKNLNFIVGLPFCHQSVFVKKNIYKKHQFQTKYKIFSTVDYFITCFINKVKFKYYDYLVSNYDYTGVSSNFNYNSVKELTKIHKNNQNINIYIYMILYYTLLKSYIKKVIKLTVKLNILIIVIISLILGFRPLFGTDYYSYQSIWYGISSNFLTVEYAYLEPDLY